MTYHHSTKTIIKNKVGLLNLAMELKNVSRACKIMGFSRDTFYRYQDAVDSGGVDNLIDKSKRQANLKNRVDIQIEEAVLEEAFINPCWGQVRVANELKRKGLIVSAGGVRGVWIRHGLENFKKRLNSLEARVATEGLIFTESQLVAMERRKIEQEACGEIETEHSGYLGGQDTFYVGTLKGVGRIYQQTFVDTFSKVSLAKLYPNKTAITAADMLNDKVLPFYEQHEIDLLRVLTDRGSEYCGKVDEHDFQLFLAVKDIDHTRTKVKHPQTNGITERFHKTILNEFYQIAFRKKLYNSLEELQVDLDQWIHKYNNERTHQGKICNGRTPMDTFLEGVKIAKSKQLPLTEQDIKTLQNSQNIQNLETFTQEVYELSEIQ